MPADTILCPFCSEEIKATAIKCRFCGEFLTEQGAAERQPPKRGGITGALPKLPPEQPPAATTWRATGTGALPQLPAEPLPPPAPRRPRNTGALPALPPLATPGAKLSAVLAALAPLIGAALLGGLWAPGFWLGLILFGVPSQLLLFHSATRYRKPAWEAALLVPALWISFVAYVVSGSLKPRELPGGKGLQYVPPVWQPLLVSTWVALLALGVGTLVGHSLARVAPEEVDRLDEPKTAAIRLGLGGKPADSAARSDEPVSYAALLKNPENHKGAPVTWQGRILDISTSDGTTTGQVILEEKNRISRGTFFIELAGPAAAAKGDTIEVKGKFERIEAYESQSDAQLYAPYILATSIRKVVSPSASAR